MIALITLLVLFIAALGEGLANGNRQYVSNLNAQLIVFLQKSDTNISSSQLQVDTVRQIRRVDGVMVMLWSFVVYCFAAGAYVLCQLAHL